MQRHLKVRFGFGAILGFSQILSGAFIPVKAQSLFIPLKPSDSSNYLLLYRTLILPTDVGMQFENSQSVNEEKIVTLQISGRSTPSGRCVGPFYAPSASPSVPTFRIEEGSTEAWFTSKKTLPLPGLRVVIRNITQTVSQDSIPYTDREYNRGDRSESFTVKQGTSHTSRYLAVGPDLNSFTYQVKRGSEVVESGSFSAMINLQTKTVNEAQKFASGFPSARKDCREKYAEQQKLERLQQKFKDDFLRKIRVDLPKQP